MTKYSGECYCGAVKFYCDGDPFFTQRKNGKRRKTGKTGSGLQDCTFNVMKTGSGLQDCTFNVMPNVIKFNVI
jgi:hypothetical protein